MSDQPIVVVNPLQITDTMLDVVNTNVPEADYAAWSSGTTYALGDRVILTSTHRIYQSLQAGNLNKSPTANPTWWVDASPTNRWAVFDNVVSSQTKQATSIIYEFTPGQTVNALAALNLTGATSMVVKVTSASLGVVYNKTFNMSPVPASPSWWDWFFGIKRGQTQKVLIDLPSYPDATIRFELYGGSTLAIGVLLVGQQRGFGTGIKYGAKLGIQDYSIKQKNDFGDTVLVQRSFAKRADFEIQAASGDVDSLQNFLSDIRAIPCLWIGSTDYEATIVFGFYKTFDIMISYPTYSDCTLQIEGLT